MPPCWTGRLCINSISISLFKKKLFLFGRQRDRDRGTEILLSHPQVSTSKPGLGPQSLNPGPLGGGAPCYWSRHLLSSKEAALERPGLTRRHSDLGRGRSNGCTEPLPPLPRLLMPMPVEGSPMDNSGSQPTAGWSTRLPSGRAKPRTGSQLTSGKASVPYWHLCAYKKVWEAGFLARSLRCLALSHRDSFPLSPLTLGLVGWLRSGEVTGAGSGFPPCVAVSARPRCEHWSTVQSGMRH